MGKKISVAHILSAIDGASADDAFAKIEKIKKRLADGDDFHALASEFSDCPSSQRGGDLGSFERGVMVEEFDEAAFQLKNGETSDIVETEFGYHLIYRTG